MPVPGRKPPEGKPVRHRVRPVYDWTEVEDKPFRGRHQLPAVQPDGRPWSEPTLHWWRVVSRMPHCRLWTLGDWQFALDTAIIAAAFHAGEIKVATELRQRERIMGTTVDARRDLRIRYVQSVRKELPASVTAIEDYRRSTGGVVEE